MLGSWSVEGGLVYNETKETFSLTDGTASYTIGAGGDFNTVKPYEIQSAFVTQSVNDYNLQKYDQKQYALIQDKATSGIPYYYYFDNNFPLSTIFLYPVPSNTPTITLYSTKILTAFTGLTDDISLPQGYDRAIVYNLATALAPDYEKEASPTVKEIAKSSKGIVFSSNSRNENNVSYVDSALAGNLSFNIYRGD